MTREHRQPFSAYLALCVTAAFLLSQSAFSGSATLIDRTIARAGQPAAYVGQVLTLYAIDQISSVQAPAATVPVSSAVTVLDNATRGVTHQGRAVSVQTGNPKKHLATGPGRGNANSQAQKPGADKGHHGKADRSSARVGSDQPGKGQAKAHAKKHR